PQLLLARGAKLRQGQIRAGEQSVGKPCPQAPRHRARAARQIEDARGGSDLDAVQDPAGEEARLRLEPCHLDGVRLSMDVARHAPCMPRTKAHPITSAL